MSIRHWPSEERPREKLLARGAGALSDVELLAIFLRVGVQGMSAVALAQEMLETLGGLPGLFGANVEAFRRIRGVGDAKFVQVRAVLELARRFLDAEIRRPEALSDPTAVRRYLEAQLRGSAREIFWGLFLDTQNRVLASMALFTGTLDQASVHPREVVKAALVHNASSVIVAHNHPSGARQASVADRALTERLKAALGLVEVRLLDHFIIADGPPISFAEQGWL